MMNPSLMAGAMAMMQQAAAANQANTSKDGGSDSAVTLDSELEEGEISPPDTPVQYICTAQKINSTVQYRCT